MSKSDGVLIYDINSCPEFAGLDMEKVMYFYREEKVVFYSSSTETGERADAPQFIPLKDIEVTFLDVNKEENMKKLNGYKDKLK